DQRRHRRADARLLGEHAGPHRADRAGRVRGADRRGHRHPGPGLHPGHAGRADGAEPGLPALLPSLPARELTGRGVAWTVLSLKPTPGATEERRGKATPWSGPEASKN